MSRRNFPWQRTAAGKFHSRIISAKTSSCIFDNQQMTQNIKDIFWSLTFSTFVQVVAWLFLCGYFGHLAGFSIVLSSIGELIYMPQILTFLAADGFGLTTIELEIISWVAQFITWFVLIYAIRCGLRRSNEKNTDGAS